MIKKPKLIQVGKGHSLFEVVDKYCLGEISGRSHNSAFHRLCSLMRKMCGETAIVENIAPPHPLYSELLDECKALETYFQKTIKFKIHRITFLSKRITNLTQLSGLEMDSYLSNAIIINFEQPKIGWKSYLFRSIIILPGIKDHQQFKNIPLLNNYIHIYKSFQCEINISEDEQITYNITGTFFCQQNSITSVCAHASLCMILNNMNRVDMITSEHINKIIGVNHTGKRIGGEKPNVSFTNEEIKKVLDRYGLTYELIDFFTDPNTDYNVSLYRYIESRCPTLFIFKTDFTTSHVVPIFGHTLNSDMWRPEAEVAYSPTSRLNVIKSAAQWVDHFIIHDDNFGMYFCLPVDALKRVTLPKHDPTFRAHYAVVIKPSRVTTSPREAEWASNTITAEWLLRRHKIGYLDIWSYRLLNRILSNKPLVIRTFLVNKKDYLKSLGSKDFEGDYFTEDEKQELTKNLPKLFWLSEITLPELYTANKHKIVDFFYGCSYKGFRGDKIDKRWLQIRFPYVLIKKEKKTISVHTMSVGSHYPLLTLDSDRAVIEW